MANTSQENADLFASVGTGFNQFSQGAQAGAPQTTIRNGTTKVNSTVSEQLEIDPAGIEKIIQDILAGEQGLAAIFGGEQNAGIFNSSVAAQAGGDLLSKLAGEIAKLTAKKTTATESTTVAKDKSKKKGNLGGIGTTAGGIIGAIYGQPAAGAAIGGAIGGQIET